MLIAKLGCTPVVRPILGEIEVWQELANKGDITVEQQLKQRQLFFLKSRQDKLGNLILPPERLTDEILQAVKPIHLALWEAFASKPIVCATSGNFGIAWYEVLAKMQSQPVKIADKKIYILNQDEGELLIWCPRRGSDIMRNEKDDILQDKINSSSLKCHLCRYENRKERDVKAICQVLENSGYFFPTNPQSEENMKALLVEISQENRNLLEKASRLGLKLKSSIRGGMYGAMIPYLYFLNEFVQEECLFDIEGSTKASVYNPTSLGGTLAGFVEADMSLHQADILSTLDPEELSVLERELPALKQYLDLHNGSLDFQTLIYAVPDNHTRPGIAGAFKVTSPHIPGDGKKFMGLGSSGFPYNSLPQEVIMRSVNNNGSFKGETHVCPTTHTMGYIAAALTFASEIQQYGKAAKLPELAGSFAVAGLLQAWVDKDIISAKEVAWILKRSGIGLEEFTALNPEDYQTETDFLLRAKSEGEGMGSFAERFVSYLAQDFQTLANEVRQYRASCEPRECSRYPLIVAHRTGDYCLQPSEELMARIMLQARKYEDLQNK
ncbi:MAG: hypothetical protein EBE86_029165 [Hormoscilla sp. GUM202]|nr:hypothetical protein [Hormoscilla sp. GUM202]